MAGQKVKVSVGIPVYNGENFIAEAIESVLAQTYDALELIIVDNDSADGTRDICERYAAQDDRVKYFKNNKNIGAAPNYNRCFELSTGEYFKWMAHDDWISPNYIELCVEVLDNYEEFGLAYGMPREMFDRDTPYLFSEFTVPVWGKLEPAGRFAKAIRMDRTCHAIFGLYRRSVIEKTTMHRPYYTSDRVLVAETALLAHFAPVPEAIFYNRKHDQQSMAQSTNRAALNTWQDASNTKSYATQDLSRLAHLWEVTKRYPELASAWRLRAQIATHVLHPEQVLRYIDEAIGSIAPTFYPMARGVAKSLLRAVKRPADYIHLR
ncbi:MAG: glycosyltransferase family 2 protein [Pseudomonadota bacterium]